jgi:peptidyl-prolyl cis-trans isomerase-like 3
VLRLGAQGRLTLPTQHSARGIVSMANSGANTNASQFFVTYAKHAHLNGKYTVFGRVIGGLEVLDAMEKV